LLPLKNVAAVGHRHQSVADQSASADALSDDNLDDGHICSKLGRDAITAVTRSGDK